MNPQPTFQSNRTIYMDLTKMKITTMVSTKMEIHIPRKIVRVSSMELKKMKIMKKTRHLKSVKIAIKSWLKIVYLLMRSSMTRKVVMISKTREVVGQEKAGSEDQ